MADSQLQLIVKMVDEASANLRRVKSEVSGLTEETKKTNSTFTSFNKTVTAGLVALGSGVVLGSVKRLTGEIINQAAAYEQSTVAFGTMLGDMQKGKDFIGELADFAAKTPFTIQGVEESSRLLLAMGIGAKDNIPTLRMLGDVAAGLSIPINQIALAYGQVRSANQLYGTELRQFIQAGVPILGELAKMFKTTEAGAKAMVESGSVGFKDVEQAFKNMTSEGGTFFNLMDAQSQTWNGQISNLQDNISKLAREIGGPLLEAAKPALEELNKLLTSITQRIREVGLKQWAEENKTTLTILAGVIGGVMVGALVGLTVAFATILGPIALAVAAFAAIGAAIGAVIAFWPQISAFFVGLYNEAEWFFGLIGSVIDMFVQKFTNGISNGLNAVLAFFRGWANLSKAAWSGLWDAMTSVAIAAWEAVKGVVKAGINWILEKINNVINSVNRTIKAAAGLLNVTSAVTIPNIPMLANGGTIMSAGAAIVGEAGPELVTLPRGATVEPLGRSGITINIINAQVLTADDIAEKIGNPLIQVLKQHMAIT